VVVAGTAQAAGLSAAEQRGKQIYVQGLSGSGAAITAHLGKESTPVPAAAVPCVGCHGEHGKGRPEGAVVPSEITWSYLTRAYGHQHAYGRTHPAFDEAGVRRAITEGVDPAGNRLDPAMPRFAMSAPDLRDLVAYLKRVETDHDPGLGADRIRIGTLLPLSGPLAGLGQAMQGLLQAYFDELNAAGGIYGRRLELVVADASGPPAARRDQAARLLHGEVFALVSPFTAEIVEDVAALAEQAQVPVVAPVTGYRTGAADAGHYSFYLFAGLAGEARALVEYAARHLALEDPRIAVQCPAAGDCAGLLRAIRGQARAHGWGRVVAMDPAAAPAAVPVLEPLARATVPQGTRVLVYLGERAALPALLRSLPRGAEAPYLLLPGSLANREVVELAAARDQPVFLAFPMLASDQDGPGATHFRALQSRGRVAVGETLAQSSAYAGAAMLVEALKRSGHELSRRTLVQALEGLQQFRPGVTRALSYGPARRVGLNGAHILTIDAGGRTLRPVGEWIELN
jgi:ABC-type branched-subunit amino acid transport system substrate-binding protein